MKQRRRIYYSAAERSEIWDRWQAGEPMSSIGRRFDRESSSVFSVISPTGGIRPPDNGNASLTLTFAQTPANQFLNITNVSCNVQVTSAQVIAAMQLNAGTTSGASDLGRYYEIKGAAAPETSGSFKDYSIVTNQIFYKFGPGRYPTILIFTTSTGSFAISASCTIVGNLTDN